ncbi:MAG: TIR domain-containing protein, partial [Prosthecobacter sp.]|uniref:TIR domain-containing protein n=1 Tax=Prosthecobacter sp. TaxID=1965333 RepID=UPI0019FC0CE6
MAPNASSNPTDSGVAIQGNRGLDAFILYHEKEKNVEVITADLELRGITTYFWRRDIAVGEPWQDVESQKLRDSRVVLVFLGAAGWGPNHLRIALEAQSLQKRLLPVLLGTPPDSALDDAGGIFRSRRYLDFREMTHEEGIESLVKAIRQSESSFEVRSNGLNRVMPNRTAEHEGTLTEVRIELVSILHSRQETLAGGAARRTREDSGEQFFWRGADLNLRRGADDDESCLNVAAYAEVLARLFRLNDPGEFSLAIFGHWGRGKTFLMERAKLALNDKALLDKLGREELDEKARGGKGERIVHGPIETVLFGASLFWVGSGVSQTAIPTPMDSR